MLSFSCRSCILVCCSALLWKHKEDKVVSGAPCSAAPERTTSKAQHYLLQPGDQLLGLGFALLLGLVRRHRRLRVAPRWLWEKDSVDLYLLRTVLVVGHLPPQLLAGLPRLLQLRLVQVAATASGRKILLKLPD